MPRIKQQVLSNRRFGLEIEFNEAGYDFWDWVSFFRRDEYNGGPYVCGIDGYQHSDGSGWELKRDGSCGLELVTPAMRWNRWRDVQATLNTLNRYNAETDIDCGLHVHHEIRDYNTAKLRRLARLWGAIEDLMFSLVEFERANNSYCMPFKDRYESWIAYLVSTEPFAVDNTIRRKGRRRAMNLMNFGTRGTVEFRLHHGTIKEAEIYNWTVFTQMITELCRRGIHNSTITKLVDLPLEVKFESLFDLISRYQEAEEVMKALEFFRTKLKPAEKLVTTVSGYTARPIYSATETFEPYVSFSDWVINRHILPLASTEEF